MCTGQGTGPSGVGWGDDPTTCQLVGKDRMHQPLSAQINHKLLQMNLKGGPFIDKPQRCLKTRICESQSYMPFLCSGQPITSEAPNLSCHQGVLASHIATALLLLSVSKTSLLKMRDAQDMSQTSLVIATHIYFGETVARIMHVLRMKDPQKFHIATSFWISMLYFRGSVKVYLTKQTSSECIIGLGLSQGKTVMRFPELLLLARNTMIIISSPLIWHSEFEIQTEA